MSWIVPPRTCPVTTRQTDGAGLRRLDSWRHTLISVAGFCQCLVVVCRKQRAFNALLATAVASAIATPSLFLCGHNSLSRSNSAYFWPEEIRRSQEAYRSTASKCTTRPAFYLQRTLTLVHYATNWILAFAPNLTRQLKRWKFPAALESGSTCTGAPQAG